ncbi:UNVERIFIED_CONTAM: hypothetical protein FKN15_038971 [Acipenser sinensis]
MEITELTFVDSKDPELEPVHIKEGVPELECVHITEEVSNKDEVGILEGNMVKLGSRHCDESLPELVCMKPNQSVSEDTGSSVGEEGIVLGSIQRKHHPPQERAADGKEEGAMASTSSTAYELASTIEHAVKAAVDTVLCEITKVVGGKFTEFQMEVAEKEKENESLKLRLEISESELKAVRECLSAAGANIKQALMNINPDCNEQDFQRNENQGLSTRVQEPEERPASSEEEEGPVIEDTQEEISDQEWCVSQMEITELTFVDSKDVPELEPVHIEEGVPELECVHITEEVSKKQLVSILMGNIVKLGSSHCDESPPELSCVKPNQPVSEDTGSSVGEEGTVLGSIQRKHHPPQERAADGKEEGAMASTSSTASGKSSRQLGSPKTHKGNRRGRAPFPCADCEMSFNYLSVLKRHKLIHTGEKPYQCNECEMRFNYSGNLKRHQRVHTGEKLYHCNECEMRFNYSAGLKRHKLIHTGEKPYQCNKCKTCFNYSGNLKRHQQIHTGEKPHYCTDCRRRFTELRSFKKHKLIHKGEKPYNCSECGKGFFRTDRLEKHREIHTAVKP